MEERWNKFSKGQRLNALTILGLPQHLIDKDWMELPYEVAAVLTLEYSKHHKR